MSVLSGWGEAGQPWEAGRQEGHGYRSLYLADLSCWRKAAGRSTMIGRRAKVTLLYWQIYLAEGTQVNHERQAGRRVKITLLYLADLSGWGDAGQPWEAGRQEGHGYRVLYLADLSGWRMQVNHERQACRRVKITVLYLADLSGWGDAGQPWEVGRLEGQGYPSSFRESKTRKTFFTLLHNLKFTYTVALKPAVVLFFMRI